MLQSTQFFRGEVLLLYDFHSPNSFYSLMLALSYFSKSTDSHLGPNLVVVSELLFLFQDEVSLVDLQRPCMCDLLGRYLYPDPIVL
mmetsp:Transcript_31068/g.30523  ORF Transcript_31068/g.30523 Transcript_31068/m.30523 type:complete len:86 (-) Transcript_31068:46-303(-)